MLGAYNIGESEHRRRLMEAQQRAAQQGSGPLGLAGGLAGGLLGAKGGAALGTMLLPGVGTALGAGLGGAMGSAVGGGRDPRDITAAQVGIGALTAGIPTGGLSEAKEVAQGAEAAKAALASPAAAGFSEATKSALQESVKAGTGSSLLGKAVSGVSNAMSSGIDAMKTAMFGVDPLVQGTQAAVDSAAMAAPLASNEFLQRQQDLIAPALNFAEGGLVNPYFKK